MEKSKRKIYVGTSSWTHKEWGGIFYPKNLKEDLLTYYSRKFPTVEINSSFYHMPSGETFSHWQKNSASGFLFSLKMNRYITHRKRLIIDEDSLSYLKAFLGNSQKLKNKLAVILIQLPPSFRLNLSRLEEFLKIYSKIIEKLKYKPSTAFEFRNAEWFQEETYKILRKYNAALVISSTPELRREIFTAGFIYIRMHGTEIKTKKYLEKDLENLKNEIESYPTNVKKVFVYFNNDYSQYAIGNAQYLKTLFERKKTRFLY